jgi:DNA polymerase I
MHDLPFREVWCVDFEFIAPPGERPEPICLVARELHSGRLIRQWRDEFGRLPPYGIGAESLFVAYYASAELGCHLALGWPMSAHVLDLCAEFKNLTSGLHVPAGRGLIGALIYHGLDHIPATEKEAMQQLATRGGPWTTQEQTDLLDYCETDVTALARLFPVMLPRIDLPRALVRGRYMIAAAAMEWNGVPIDVPVLTCLRERWETIQSRLIEAMPVAREVYDGKTFKVARFANWLAAQNISWPRLPSGVLSLEDDTFCEMADVHPAVRPIYELRSSMSKLRLSSLTVGKDGRNRTLLGAFASKTGRNQPSNSKFIFGPAKWMRGLIKPPPGYGVAYIDWGQQEFGIAAALSGDPAMLAAYRSGDPYLAFAQQAGAVPEDATAQSHPDKRDLFKNCALAVQYGMGYRSLAVRINRQPVVAKGLLAAHKSTYPRFWAWSENAVNHAIFAGSLRTVFGWHVHAGEDTNPRSLMNFPMQANGAEMLRLACCFGIKAGVEICAPIHDAVLIAAPLDWLSDDIDKMQSAMRAASRAVLGGFELRTEVKPVRFPERYMDKRGADMWDRTMQLLDEIELEAAE